MIWITKTFDELNVHELYNILQLRAKVFVVEQNCAYLDLDDTDKNSWHLFGEENGAIVAYARLIPQNINYPEASIGRVVTDPSVRGKRIGKELMKYAITKCENLFNTKNITISAQTYLKKFYNELGFKETGEEYLEDNIPHIKMNI
ncbi:MAG: GNAT family N-acetyltransferase [Rhodospirillales bacterium]|nr:GNAT family N-acetyltransferase [Rhodospirillales bacterium]